jgi:hypothetical protein
MLDLLRVSHMPAAAFLLTALFAADVVAASKDDVVGQPTALVVHPEAIRLSGPRAVQ